MVKKTAIPIIISASPLFGVSSQEFSKQINKAVDTNDAQRVATLFIQKDLARITTAHEAYDILSLAASLQVLSKIDIETIIPVIELCNNNGETPLLIAIKNENSQIARFLIKHGADINKASDTQETPLIAACWRNQFDIATLLLERGAHPNKMDKTNKTALFYAIKTGHEKIIRLLIDYGANIDTPEENSSLELAMLFGHSDLVMHIQKQKTLDK